MNVGSIEAAGQRRGLRLVAQQDVAADRLMTGNEVGKLIWGMSAVTVERREDDGTFPPAVYFGAKVKRRLEREHRALRRAFDAGATREQLRDLSCEMAAARSTGDVQAPGRIVETFLAGLRSAATAAA